MTATTAAPPTKNVFRLHGVNVLNRKNVDSISRLTALEKRRATHILDERQRRDTMNQLLAELANLVRESSAEVDAHNAAMTAAPQLNADGTEKKPAVKSNSITTLRNAIVEIRRLRSCAGLETITPPCPASQATQTSSASSSRSSSPSPAAAPAPAPKQTYSTLPALAPSSTPHYMAPISPKSYPTQAPNAPFHQLQSPPLSPSSPASHKYSSASPPMTPTHRGHHQVPSLPSLFGYQQQQQPQSMSPQYSSYQQHPQQHPSYYAHPHHSFNSPQYEPVQPFSRSSSPAPAMHLPQPYLQHAPVYSSSTSTF